ncbi:MAG: uracil-DNA glycosylase [Candidatus Paceibacterota bacterium]
MSNKDKTAALEALKDEVVALEASPLYTYRQEHGYLPVLGEGSHDADIMFIGEAPGESEAKTGRPFCGRSGKLLDEFLEHINLDRADVYITNVLKDRPPENRDPQTDEIEIYTPFLRRQISIIQPKVIATLGRFSMEFIADEYGIELDGTITQVRGKIYEIDPGTTSSDPVEESENSHEAGDDGYGAGEDGQTITFIPLFHPAVALYDGSKRDVLKEDFETLADFT